MTRSEAEKHLKKSTVKIDSPYDVGSGFFIDKNLIATCHHVVEDCSASELVIVWQGNSYQATSIESNPNDDLALVSVKIDKKHPCVQIDKSIETGDECFSFGFPKAYRELGDTLTFVSEGHNKKFLKFKDGQFESGFSGAPILNYRTLKVCGVVKRTRDEYSNLGGRGIPISKLFDFESLDIDDNGSIFSKEMFKNWVWTSSVESADKLQFSVLALVETLVAVGISFYLWIFQGFYYHIIVGLVVAPFFFLKTTESTNIALKYFSSVSSEDYLNEGDYIGDPSAGWISADRALNIVINLGFIILLLLEYRFLLILLYLVLVQRFRNFIKKLIFLLRFLILLPLLLTLSFSLILGIIVYSMYIKVYTIFKTFSKKNILSIPKNWFQLILSIDSTHVPEIVYNIEKIDTYFSFSSIKNKVHNDAFYNYLFILFIPAIIFRYSLKSTAWIYLPLIWLIQPQDRENLTRRLKIESKNFIAYLMFFYSLIVVFIFTLLPLIFPNTELGVYLQTLAIPETFKTIFFAYEFNLWHLTRFLSALITIVFIVSFTKILIRRENGEPSYGDFWGAKLLSLRDIRSVLTLITLGFTAYHILGLLPDGFFGELWVNMKVLPEE